MRGNDLSHHAVDLVNGLSQAGALEAHGQHALQDVIGVGAAVKIMTMNDRGV